MLALAMVDDADDRADDKLPGLELIRFRIICVAAENCGTYGGRPVELAVLGAGLGALVAGVSCAGWGGTVASTDVAGVSPSLSLAIEAIVLSSADIAKRVALVKGDQATFSGNLKMRQYISIRTPGKTSARVLVLNFPIVLLEVVKVLELRMES